MEDVEPDLKTEAKERRRKVCYVCGLIVDAIWIDDRCPMCSNAELIDWVD